jgi:transposase
MLECANRDSEFLKTVITGDKMWVYGYGAEMKVQSFSRSIFHPQGPKSTTGAEKSQGAAVFFDYRGIVHHSCTPEGQTLNKEYYLEVIHHLRDAFRRKRLDVWVSRNWQLHPDNAPAYSSHLIQSFLAKHGIPVVCQAPYSPDMVPSDSWLFPKLKKPLKGSHFDSREDIMRNVTKELRSLPEEAFQKCFQQWKERWAKCGVTRGLL